MARFPTVPRIVLFAALLATAACGGDTTAPRTPSVAGTWTLAITNVSGSGISCSLSGTTLSVQQTGTTFSGTYGGGVMTCLAGGQSISAPLGTGAVINGTVTGNAVSFDLDSPDFAFTGTVSGNSMSGTCMLREDLGQPYGVITLNGNWGAGR